MSMPYTNADTNPLKYNVVDVFRHSVESFQDYKYLGTRIRVDGTVGE